MSQPIRVLDGREAIPPYVPSYIDDMGLDVYTFRIYVRLARRSAASGIAWETVANMAEGCRMSDRKAHEALRELEQLGLAKREERPGTSSIYTLISPQGSAPGAEGGLHLVQRGSAPGAPKVSSEVSKRREIVPPGGNEEKGEGEFSISVIKYLNGKVGSSFKLDGKSNLAHIHARLTDGYTTDDLKAIVDHKTAQWKDDPKMAPYLCPETLFGRPSKFDAYLQAARGWISKGRPVPKMTEGDRRNLSYQEQDPEPTGPTLQSLMLEERKAHGGKLTQQEEIDARKRCQAKLQNG